MSDSVGPARLRGDGSLGRARVEAVERGHRLEQLGVALGEGSRPLEEHLRRHGEELGGVRRGVAPEHRLAPLDERRLAADERRPRLHRAGVEQRRDAVGVEVVVVEEVSELVEDDVRALLGRSQLRCTAGAERITGPCGWTIPS